MSNGKELALLVDGLETALELVEKGVLVNIIDQSIPGINFEGEIIGATQKMLLIFSNDYKLSIIRGEYTYGGKDGLFEIAVIKDPEGLVDVFEWDNTVKGYLTPIEVVEYMNRVATL